MTSFLLVLLLCLRAALANVEKTIFLGPPTVNVPLQHPTLEALHIDVLTPSNPSIRTHVQAAREIDSPYATWLLLDELREGQRYEVRICWSASEPTDFDLNTWELPQVWETPELLVSMWEYAQSRQPGDAAGEEPVPRIHRPAGEVQGEREASVLFLRLDAKASYYAANATLMENVPPVYVDIILDPFLLNVLPRSLAPTGAYVVVVAVVSFFVARLVARWLSAVATTVDDAPTAEAKKKQ